jgi:hypothetical protein
MYGPPHDCKGKRKGEETSLRKCIRPLMEISSPGHNELRVSVLICRSVVEDHSRYQAADAGWRGRGVLAGNHGLYSAEALAEQKRVRELLAQSRELLKQMQAG